MYDEVLKIAAADRDLEEAVSYVTDQTVVSGDTGEAAAADVAVGSAEGEEAYVETDGVVGSDVCDKAVF